MHFNTEDLLSFCAEYALAKSAARLPLSTLKNGINFDHQAKHKQIKPSRKKIEAVESKNVVKKNKPKIQQVITKKQKIGRSPIQQKLGQNKKYDLDYFMYQLSDCSFGQNYDQMLFRPQQHQHTSFNIKKLETQTHNFDTFGKGREDYAKEFQIFDQKVKTQVNINNNLEIKNVPLKSNFSQQSMAQRLKNFSQNNSWLFVNQKPRQITDAQSQKVCLPIPYYQQSQVNENKLNYSPSARNYSPAPSSSLSSSWIKNLANNENSLSKSPNMHQRNKSEILYYDASKLAGTVEHEPQIGTKQDQFLLSQSFSSIADSSNMKKKYKKQQLVLQKKRDTSTTIAPKKYPKIQQRIIQNLTSLNKVRGQSLIQLQRMPPNTKQIKI